MRRATVVAFFTLIASIVSAQAPTQHSARDAKALEQQFLAVPDPKRAEEYMRVLTSEPHIAGTPEDKKTADYVAGLFRSWGLETEVVPYRVWMNYPVEVSIDMTALGLAIRHDARAARLLGESARLERQGLVPELPGKGDGHRPSASSCHARRCRAVRVEAEASSGASRRVIHPLAGCQW